MAVSLICWALWLCGCQSDMLGFVAVYGCQSAMLGFVAVYGCQSDMLGFVTLRLSVLYVGLCGFWAVSLICWAL